MGILQKIAVLQGKRPWGIQEKRWPKYRYCFSCLKVRGGSLPFESSSDGFQFPVLVQLQLNRRSGSCDTPLCRHSFQEAFLKYDTPFNRSTTALESGNATGAFLQTPAPVLDKISGPMGARFLSSTGLGFGNLIGRAQFSAVPALDKNRSPNGNQGKRKKNT